MLQKQKEVNSARIVAMLSFKMTHNGWVYENVCLDELSITDTVDSKLSYTPCYV